jgi:predicted PurR-regulated permease PerM
MPDLVGQTTVERFRRWGIIAWSTIGVLILAAAVFWALGHVTEIFPPLFVALITIYLTNPLVTRLEVRGLNRVFGSCLTYVLLIAVGGAAIALLIPVLVNQGSDFARALPRAVDRYGDVAHRISLDIEERVGGGFRLSEWVGNREDLVADALRSVGGFLQSAAQALTLIAIGLVIGFYLVVDLPRMRRAAIHMVPPDRREEIRKIAGAVAATMGAFFRGQLLVAMIVGLMSALGMLIIGLPSWAVVGLICGFFNLVPLIGPFIGAVPAILIAATLGSPIKIVLVIVILIVVQQIDNHFISPNVMSWSVKLHAVTVMLSLTVGATLSGLFGMLVAVPIAAALKVVFAHIWRTRVPWGEEVFAWEERLEERASKRGPPHLEAARLEVRPPVLPGAPEGPPPPE